MTYKFEIKFGFWIAFTGFMWLLIERIIGLQDSLVAYKAYSSLLFALPIIVGIFWAVFSKSRASKEALPYAALLKIGALVTVAGATLYLVFSYAFFTLVNTNYQTVMVNLTLENAKAKPEKLEELRTLAEASFAPGSVAMQSFAYFVMVGVLFSLICPLFLLKRK